MCDRCASRNANMWFGRRPFYDKYTDLCHLCFEAVNIEKFRQHLIELEEKESENSGI